MATKTTTAKTTARPAARTATRRKVAAAEAPAKAVTATVKAAAKTAATPAARKAAPAAAKAPTTKAVPAKVAEPKPKAEKVELPEWVTVERKRRFANVTTRVINLAHPSSPEGPRVFADFGDKGPVFDWAAECIEHGEKGYFRRKDIAEANAADPWIFCSTCAHVMGQTAPVKR